MSTTPSEVHDRIMKNHHSRDPAMRPLRRLMVAAVVVFVGLGLATTRGAGPDQPSNTPDTYTGYTHEELQLDANMTQRMSVANANTDSQIHSRDPQLVRSQDPNYVRALEQHQADVDRMLARQNP
jgi:hypothetical protein